jgi:3-deoxy-D-manno-octulosonic-acid transferase
MLLLLYSFALLLALAAGTPYWLSRLITSGKYRHGIAERLGRVPARLNGKDRLKTIWLHAVSVGEVVAALSVVEQLKGTGEGQKREPRFRVVVSTTTRAGQQLARDRVGPDDVFYFPLDFAWIVRRYLARLQPVMLVLVESELWPNVITECSRAGVPIAVINGRISDRSLPRYLRLRPLWRRILIRVSAVLAQSPEDAKRFKTIGIPAERVTVTGNLKFDARVAKPAGITEEIRQHLPWGMRVLVCGSTAEGEEGILLQAFQEIRKTEPNLVMILAPRHPERFDAVAELIRDQAEVSLRRTQWISNSREIAPGTVILLDSVGELASVYSLASVAFVGKSLRGSGGHNPLEPAQFGVPIVMGPHYENFVAVVDWLLKNDAIKLVTDETLTDVLVSLLSDRESADQLGLRALDAFDSQSGSTQKTVDGLLELLGSGGRHWESDRGDSASASERRQ